MLIPKLHRIYGICDNKYKLRDVRRFIIYVRINKTTGCWEWSGYLNKWGYGNFKVCNGGGRKSYLPHRVSYEMFYNQQIPDGLLVCHKCDNPRCVNPSHLWLGTNQDNINDMINKGRDKKAKSENNGNVKLTRESVNKMRELYSIGEYGSRELGEMFGVTKTQILYIVNYKSWK